ncbi:MAG TPA: glycosyltransferase family 4 protein [Lamprocystis sp. (in: g-proteobacteria)]|nr:glycosyltransferase family 4 protein [Lamprocystis sp. (in: g-proteobacteria)]
MSPTVLGLSMLLTAFVLSAALARWLAGRPAWSRALLDHPNERSLHAAPVPRSGGLAVLAGLIAAVALGWIAGLTPDQLPWVTAGALPVAAISLLDDLGQVSRRLRFAVHLGAGLILAAGGLVWGALDLPGGLPEGLGGPIWRFPAPVAWLVTVLFVVWMINLYNFMDGMDGFAGGMAVFGFGALAVLGWQGGDPAFALVAAGIAAAAGFLTSNFPPARLFLGDLGSSTLGLFAAALSLWGASTGLFPLWVAWLAFSPFIVDATWTLGRRMLRGERVWEAHRSHHYQRLVLAGWGHRKTVLRAYVLMAGTTACAVAAPDLPASEQWLLLLAWAAIYVLIHVRVRLAEGQRLPGY